MNGERGGAANRAVEESRGRAWGSRLIPPRSSKTQVDSAGWWYVIWLSSQRRAAIQARVAWDRLMTADGIPE